MVQIWAITITPFPEFYRTGATNGNAKRRESRVEHVGFAPFR
jgi:hypothetical protein